MNDEPTPAKSVIAPYFSLTRATWMACVVEWDSETGEFRHLVGVQSFASYREALQASRFLVRLDHRACNRRPWNPGCVRGVSGGVTPRGSIVA